MSEPFLAEIKIFSGNFAIRNGKWKLVDLKLFDLDADPKEANDVAAQNPAVVKHMADTLKRYQQGDRSRQADQ